MSTGSKNDNDLEGPEQDALSVVTPSHKQNDKSRLLELAIGEVTGGPAAAQRFKDLVASTLRLQE